MNSALLEDYPSTFNKQDFENIKSFQGKLDYAVTHMKKIATGSARAVFKVDEQKVLKIAKNKKGLAQNRAESDPYLQNYDITARVFDMDRRNDFWLEMELATKLTPTKFKEITGVTIDQVSMYVCHKHAEHNGKKSFFSHRLDPQILEKLDNNEFLIDLLSLMQDMNMPCGDLGRLSSFGEVKRNGKPAVVLVDFGLTQEIYDDFYKVR